MGTRTYSRRGANGVRVPTALGIRTGRFTQPGLPAYASGDIPQGWRGADGDVGISKEIGGMVVSIVPNGFERPGSAYYSLELSDPMNPDAPRFSFVLSRNPERTWGELESESRDVVDMLSDALNFNGDTYFTIGDNQLVIEDAANDVRMAFDRDGNWNSENTEFDPDYGITYSAGGKNGQASSALAAMRLALEDFLDRQGDNFDRRAGIYENPAAYNEPALSSTSLPEGWKGASGDVGIEQRLNRTTKASLIPDNFERPGRRVTWTFELGGNRANSPSFSFGLPDAGGDTSWGELSDQVQPLMRAFKNWTIKSVRGKPILESKLPDGTTSRIRTIQVEPDVMVGRLTVLNPDGSVLRESDVLNERRQRGNRFTINSFRRRALQEIALLGGATLDEISGRNIILSPRPRLS